MGKKFVGSPGTSFEIKDISNIISNSISGKICVQGITSRGIAGETYQIGNWGQYLDKLGSYVQGDDFVLMCKAAIEHGAVLYVTRALHYTDIDDIDTVDGTEATGTITETTNTISFEALAVGDGYNGTTIETKASKSGISGQLDLLINLNGATSEIEIVGIDKTAITTADITTLNNILKSKNAQLKVTSIANEIPVGTVSLSSGAITIASIVAADYNGSNTAKNGWHAFDTIADSMRIFNLNKADADVDTGLAAYVSARKDMRACLRTPLGLTNTTIAAYLKGTTPYSHTAIDSMFVDYFYTDGEVTDPQNSDIRNKSVSLLGHYAGLRAYTDNYEGVWFSAAGYKEDAAQKIKGVNKIPTNFIAAGNKTDYDTLYEDGLNSIVNHPSFGVVPWGNRNCLKDKTKMTSKQNIADLSVYIARELKQLAERFNFKPNDYQMFNAYYRKVLPFIKSLVKGRAIQGDSSATAGEGSWWFWYGDQFATTPDELTFNTPTDIDAGGYKVKFVFKPIGANEYIAITVAPSDSVTIKNIEIISQA